MEKVLYECLEVDNFFARTVKRHLQQPALWHDLVCPTPGLTLIFAQKGCYLNANVRTSVKKNGLEGVTKYWTCSRNIKETSEAMWTLNNSYDPNVVNHLLIIENGHLLMQMTDLYQTTMDLAKSLSFTFIVVLTEALPSFSEFFWNQFQKELTILYSLPTREDRMNIWKTLWKTWNDHGYSVHLNDEDFAFLVDASDFCTPFDMLQFVRRVTRYILNEPEAIAVDKKLLVDRFIHTNAGFNQTESICENDRSMERHRYMAIVGQQQENPKNVEEVTAYLDRQKELKRHKKN